MKLQTEFLANRVARLRVEVEDDQLEKARRDAARRLAQRVSIPGFRKGKAPYNIVAQYLGEGAILEEAIDELGPQLYRQALEEADLEPYGPGQLEDIEGNGRLTFVFTVPLVPTVDLGDYRSIRHNFEPPEVTDEMVDNFLKRLQNERAIIEPKEGPAAPGDRVSLVVHGELIPAETESRAETPAGNPEAASEGEGADEGESDPEFPIDDDEWTLVLGEADNEPLPGFYAAVEGITAGEERTFELRFPEEGGQYDESLRGRQARFQVTCQEVAARYVPSLNDDFAQQVSGGEYQTLLELRMKMREMLQEELTRQLEQEYANEVLDRMVEQATIDYPEAMLEDFIDDMVHNFELTLRQQGLQLQDYLKLSQMDEDALRQDFRESAINRLKHSLVLRELVRQEELDVDDAAVTQEIKARSARFGRGDQTMQDAMEQFLSREQSRRDIAADIMTQRAYQRLVAIARGEEPPIGPPPAEEAGDAETGPQAEGEQLEAASSPSKEEPAA